MKEFYFREYEPNQIKEYINSRDLYAQYLAEIEKIKNSFRYYYGFQKVNDKEYLFKENMLTKKRDYFKLDKEKALSIKNSYDLTKKSFMEKHAKTKEALKKREAYNKFESINRVPNELIAILRKINEMGLNKKVIVIGTNSLYAYEAKCGVFIEQQLLATDDIDLLNKRDKKISLAFLESSQPKNIVELLKSIDKTFEQNEKIPYAFINKNNTVVEIVNPHSKTIKCDNTREDPFFDEVIKLEMNKIEWLENSRLFQAEIIGLNGKIAKITTIHPLDYAVYKNWLSNQPDRVAYKRVRDKTQSLLVTKLIKEYLINIDIEEELSKMKHLNLQAIELYKEKIIRIGNSKEIKDIK